MKQIVINVEAAAFECVVGVLQLCEGVEVERIDDEDIGSIEQIGRWVAQAIETIRKNKAIRTASDFTWLMAVMNEYQVDGIEGFSSARSFIRYLTAIGVNDFPNASTISRNYKYVDGVFPDWSFTDTVEDAEVLRRIGVARQFLAAFNKAKRT